MCVLKSKVLFIPLFFISFIAGCDTVSFIEVNVKEPANIVLPPEIHRIIVLNNLKERGEKHIFLYKGEERTLKLPTDSIPDIMCEVLWENLSEEHFFESADYFRTFASTANDLSYRLTVRDIFNETETDAIISLELCNINSTLTLQEITDYGLFQATYEINTKALFNMYSETGVKIGSALVNDTLFWEGYGMDENITLAQLPPLEEALLVAAESAGIAAMKKIIPHWTTEYRRYYSSTNGDMKKAANFVKKDEWEAAFEIWKKIYTHTDNLSRRAQCAANMALYYELQNEFDLAASWATQAKEEFGVANGKNDIEEIYYLNDYIQRLSNRKKESYMLDIQERKIIN